MTIQEFLKDNRDLWFCKANEATDLRQLHREYVGIYGKTTFDNFREQANNSKFRQYLRSLVK